MILTIDTSALLAVLVNEEHKPLIIERTQNCMLQSPASLDAEIGNALSAMIRRGRISIKEAKGVIDQFNLVRIRRTPIRLTKVAELAETFGIYAYDGYVLDCAKQYRTPLLSLDKEMNEIAKQLKIPTLEVPI